ncbi:hypothetical protein [Leuconostoc gasicomitatum]|uniref:Uncharacterized protein n=1 Tax=Leuconostoc gasicomitatum TaxID=115778 RepID=A0A9Q3SYY4_9LACO|nr:hypothetical protein [Leuconostoc gasicomitatum]MBZ5962661.1 hypothetical protein [Leuconostoc gasicomitatum]
MGKLVTAKEMYDFLMSLPSDVLEKESQEVKSYLSTVDNGPARLFLENYFEVNKSNNDNIANNVEEDSAYGFGNLVNHYRPEKQFRMGDLLNQHRITVQDKVAKNSKHTSELYYNGLEPAEVA